MTLRPSPLFALTDQQTPCFSWLEKPFLKKTIAALESVQAGAACFVGGCVRDSLVGVEPKDFDIATPLDPSQVMTALRDAGIRAVPTGFEHGTVTAVADHTGIEITSLRADVSTDGRRATVVFTTDWAIDAHRRDFRLNAIYLTPDGQLYNPVEGLEDLRAGRVRFIGDPKKRIEEDYLRILRFFRFSARFAKGCDQNGLAACRDLKSGIEHLSAERVGDEFSKILCLTDAPTALNQMVETGVLEKIWPAAPTLKVLSSLKKLAPDAQAPLGLAALFGADGKGIDSRLRLSKVDTKLRKQALDGARQIRVDLTEQEARALMYRLGVETYKDAVLLAQARSSDDFAWEKLRMLPQRFTPPTFELSGKDIIARGIKSGPQVAKLLNTVEEDWIGEDFPPSPRAVEILCARIADMGSD